MRVFNRSEALRRFYDELMAEACFYSDSELNFAQMTAAIIRHKGYNRKVFTEKTRLSTKTYDRIMRDDIPTPSLQTAMSVCIGLQLGLEQGERLLEKAGFRLNSSPLHMTYRKLLGSPVGHSVKSSNEVLRALRLPTLQKRPGRTAT
jgi:hypothetical protein